MNKREFTFLSADHKTRIHAIVWEPDGECRGVLQICHGMVEYIDRYDEFAGYLNERGWMVVGHDHLGHGKSVTSETELGYFGHPDGNQYVIADIHALRKQTQTENPGVPYFMLGHSMGSFLLRQYLEMHGNGLKGAIIMGTGTQPGIVLKLGKIICKTIAVFRGWHYRSTFVDNMAFGGYNKKFEPARTKNDWLTKDTTIVERYCQDPLCTFQFTVNAYYQMFRGIEYAQIHVDQLPKKLPLLLTAGAQDPVGNFGKSVSELYEIYQKAGIQDVSLKLYENDRHEILNETDRQDVYGDIAVWLERHLG